MGQLPARGRASSSYKRPPSFACCDATAMLAVAVAMFPILQLSISPSYQLLIWSQLQS